MSLNVRLLFKAFHGNRMKEKVNAIYRIIAKGGTANALRQSIALFLVHDPEEDGEVTGKLFRLVSSGEGNISNSGRVASSTRTTGGCLTICIDLFFLFFSVLWRDHQTSSSSLYIYIYRRRVAVSVRYRAAKYQAHFVLFFPLFSSDR